MKHSIWGGDGDDQIEVGPAGGLAYGGSGHDRFIGGVGNDTFYGGVGNDYAFGDDGDDLLYGEDGEDMLEGGLGLDAATAARMPTFSSRARMARRFPRSSTAVPGSTRSGSN